MHLPVTCFLCMLGILLVLRTAVDSAILRGKDDFFERATKYLYSRSCLGTCHQRKLIGVIT